MRSSAETSNITKYPRLVKTPYVFTCHRKKLLYIIPYQPVLFLPPASFPTSLTAVTNTNRMAKKDLTKSSKLLLHIVTITELGKYIIGTPYSIGKQWNPHHPKQTASLLTYLINKRLIRFVDVDNQKFIEVTKQGKIEALFHKALIPFSGIWDKKWRVVVFDIPEASRDHRFKIRYLLKKMHFKALQASVYISPYPLNQEAINYLHQTNLHQFIRILLVEKLDDDLDLKKTFNLSSYP